MNKKGKILEKILASVVLFSIISIPVIAWASSYTSSLSFNTTLRGQTRSFTGKNISMSATCCTTGTNSSSKYSVSLYRKNTITSDYIGSANFNRNGSSSATWSNVGKGNYYFYFSKSNDGAWVKAKSGNVKMSN